MQAALTVDMHDLAVTSSVVFAAQIDRSVARSWSSSRRLAYRSRTPAIVELEAGRELLLQESPALGTLAAASPRSSGGPVKRSLTRKLEPIAAPDTDDQALLDQVVGFFADALTGSADALEFLARRKIAHPEAVEAFMTVHGCPAASMAATKGTREDLRAVRTPPDDQGNLRRQGEMQSAADG
jgi:hypothetical protein